MIAQNLVSLTTRARSGRRALCALAVAVLSLAGAVSAGGATTVDATASSLVGEPTAVACVDLAQHGWWGAAQPGLAYIQLDHEICSVLASAPRLRRGHDTHPSSGAAVLTLAHEAAHVRGVEDEREADCFGIANLRRTALGIGYRPAQMRTLRAQAHAVSECR
jgi:hypothetical protein